MQYDFYNKEEVLIRFRNMIQKLVPDFDDAKQYVLWLVPNFWTDKILYDIQGTVKLYDVEDKEIDIAPYGLQKTKCLTRTPYYNKGIRQIGIQKGRSRIFGVPLIFDDYQEILDIKTIKIHWEIMLPIFFSEKATEPMFIRPITLDVVYRLNFDTTNIENNHWFTLNYQDTIYDMQDEESGKHTEEYYDIALGITGYHVIYDCRDNIPYGAFSSDDDLDIYDWYEISSADGKTRPLSEEEKNAMKYLNKQPFAHLINKAIELEKEYNKKRILRGFRSVEWDIDRYFYEKTITLTADPYADIIPESGFGFK